jgi:hypothetical protein
MIKGWSMKTQETIQRAKARRSDRERQTIYVSRKIFTEAKSLASEVSINRLIEELLRTFVDEKKAG